MDQASLDQLKEYLDNALDGIGNAIAVSEDVGDEHLAQKLRTTKADIISTIEGLEQRK